jgi:hypothetical protein
MFEGDRNRAKVLQKVTCHQCEHVWVIATLLPTTLAEVDAEEQRAETD